MALSGGNRFCPLIISQQDVSPHHGMIVELKIASHISQGHYSSSTLSKSHGYPPSPQYTQGTTRVWQAVVLYLGIVKMSSHPSQTDYHNLYHGTTQIMPVKRFRWTQCYISFSSRQQISGSILDLIKALIMTPAWSRPWLWDSLTVGYRSKLHPYYWDTVTVTPRLLRQGHCLLLGGLWHLCWIYPVW